MNLNDYWTNAFWSVIPTIAVVAAFWFVLRSIVRADRSERKAHAKIEQQLRAERNQPRQLASTDDERGQPDQLPERRKRLPKADTGGR
ncbi:MULTISPECIES: hypothetical protein [Microbacterium]|uniref:hypothetical protein n=1 Tax=Microbacterium TaxID=33882 RepID=UPI00164FD381|nr:MULTISPECIES: hypothetical protein [Microbacterium]MDX2399498.1 hypothetical protein [Microbacterium algeriense]